MLIIRTDLPAEANAVQLLDPIGGHARWLALKVQLVLTTLTLDPENLFVMRIGVSKIFP